MAERECTHRFTETTLRKGGNDPDAVIRTTRCVNCTFLLREELASTPRADLAERVERLEKAVAALQGAQGKIGGRS